ncbi:Serine protease Do-like HtrB [compost metagenome]
MDDAVPIINELIQNKKISRPFIGIAGFNLDSTTAEKYKLVEGIYVSEISAGTPAQKASMQKGDIITEIDGTKITTMEKLNEIKNTKKVGDKVTLKVYRQGKYVDITITLEEDTSAE